MKHRLSRATRLAEIVAEYGLAPQSVEALDVLLDQLAGQDAPTTVHAPLQSLDVHIADSLSGLHVPALRQATTVADLGSGAGLPALVLAVAKPHARVFAVESARRKAAFIERAASAMQLGNLEAVASRVEEWTPPTDGCDVVCARALASLPVLLEYAAPLLRLGGTFVAWKATVTADESRAGEAAAAILGLRFVEIRPVRPFADADARALHVFEKVSDTPAKFPRRAGMATKRPLTAT